GSAQNPKLRSSNDRLSGTFRLYSADLDNNGANDLLVSDWVAQVIPGGTAIWLNSPDNKLEELQPATQIKRAASAVDVNGDGRLDLLGASNTGEPIQEINHGTKN